MKKRLAIIGCAGFIGTSLLKSLRRSEEYSIVAIDTDVRLRQREGFLHGAECRVLNYPSLDELDSAISGVDAIVHLSCTSTPATSMFAIAKDAADNIIPSTEIFETACKRGVRTIIFASSGGTVYGNPTSIPVKEDAVKSPLSAYGASKLAIENMLSVMSAYYGISGISLRLGNPYGTFQLNGASVGVIANYLKQVYSGNRPEIWGNGSVVRDYIHIDDVSEAFGFALRSADLPSGSYNIGSGMGHSIDEIWDVIKQITGTSIEPEYKQSRGFDVQEIVLDIDCFRSATGWTPKKSLSEGVHEIWETLIATQRTEQA